MRRDATQNAENYTRAHRRKQRWHRVMTFLACVVVFCTVYALILPAVTMEEACQIPEHTHTPECYTQVSSVAKKVPVCDEEMLNIHQHTQACYDESGEIVCGYADFVVHQHNSSCYDEDGTLWCPLPEIEAHEHTDICYASTEEGTSGANHTHTDDCYTVEPGDLICGLEESEEHQHTDECYEQKKTLVCNQEETAGEPVLICEKPEVELHTHTSDCYDENGSLICGKIQVLEHVHTDACFETVAEPADTEALTCTNTDENHTHTALCYGTWELTCGMEEHTHGAACGADTEADTETAEAWEQTFADTKLTGEWPADVLAIAETQLGYGESIRNYIVLEDGLTRRGYTRYGQWYGAPYGVWDGMFVSFCLNYAGVEGMPLEADCGKWITALSGEEYDLYRAAAEHDPAPGELIFFDTDGDGQADRVGLVAEILPATEQDPAQIKTIQGDAENRVQYVICEAGDETILGYGLLPERTQEETRETTLQAEIYEDESYSRLSQTDAVITVTGVLPADAVVFAYPVSPEVDGQLLCAYDITIFLPDGTVFQPEADSPLKVTIQLPDLIDQNLDENYRPEAYFVPEDGTPEKLDTRVTEDGVSFDVNHFSVYMVLAVQQTQVSTADALKAAISSSASNIQLAADFSVSGTLTIPEGANITLDLNGHVLTASGSAALFAVQSGETLTIVDSQQGTETVEAVSGSQYGNTASLSDGTLTYYVTTTSVTNSATGATQETLEKHTVPAKGAIVGGSQPVFQVTDGTLNIQSGMIRGGTGRAIVQTGGTINFSGGYICGFTQSSGSTDNTSFGGAVKASGGELNLSGGVLAGNTAHNGGAIYATGSTKLSITGGVISGNTANRTTSNWDGHSESGAYRCGGGGIYADGNAEITMSGGYISNNVATHDGYFDGGGGVCLSGTSSMALSGGYVTGNQAQGGGGIRTDFRKETTFVMTGGFVSGNVATHAEGGGIAIDRNGMGTVTGGYITNNKIPNTGHWGGGGLFCADGSTLNLKNTLITENTCGGFGAGVAGCPTGNLYLYVTEGCAIYDNTDTVDGDSPHFTSDGVKQIDKEICTEVFQSNGHADYFCALNSTVTGTMLGNNAANWQGSTDYQPVIADAEDVLTATRVMGLQAHPTEEAKSAAQSAAKVYINGNYSYTHGGGIMCNGNLVIGVPVNLEVPARIELQATKRLVDGSGNAQSLEDNDFSFKVTMMEPDGTVIASGVCDSSGKITFDHQLTFKQEGTFVYYVYEEAGEENGTVTYDSTLYRLTMAVTKDNGVAWYGDTIKYSYTVTSVKVESSTDGETWNKVSESSASQSGVISLPLTSGATFINHLIQPTKITVQKKWEGGTGADSVTVILKKDGAEFDRQTLNAGNNWTYTWDNLEPGHSYTVEEVEIPGYTASYEITTSTDSSGSTSLGQGSWWVPATELTAGQQYLIVSPDGTKALCIASGGEGDGFNTADVTSVTQQQTAITINGQTYSTWYQAADIPARSIYNAEALTRSSHSGIVLKRSDNGNYPYLRLESNNNNYLKGASSTAYASFMVFDGTYLKGHNASEWSPDNLRTVIYADGKFNTTTEQNPANAAKLYTLVSGEGFTGSTTDSTTVVITNTRDIVPEYVLPETGGTGTTLYTMGGLLLMAAAGCLLLYSQTKRRKEDSASS